MRNITHKGLLAICILLAGALTLPTAIAKTPDGMTPSEEVVCSDLSMFNGPMFGLCNAWCEAMDCNDPPDEHRSNQRACDRVEANFEKFAVKKGYTFMDGETPLTLPEVCDPPDEPQECPNPNGEVPENFWDNFGEGELVEVGDLRCCPGEADWIGDDCDEE